MNRYTHYQVVMENGVRLSGTDPRSLENFARYMDYPELRMHYELFLCIPGCPPLRVASR